MKAESFSEGKIKGPIRDLDRMHQTDIYTKEL